MTEPIEWMSLKPRDKASLDALRATDPDSYQILAAVASSLPVAKTGLGEHETLVAVCGLIEAKLLRVSMRIKNTHVDVRWQLPPDKSWRYVRIDFE